VHTTLRGYDLLLYNVKWHISITGRDGLIIVDTTENGKSALKIMEEFRKITSKPIKGIIYTHFHLGSLLAVTLLMKIVLITVSYDLHTRAVGLWAVFSRILNYVTSKKL